MAAAPKRINNHGSVIADDTPLLTPALIRQIEQQLAADKRLLAELPARIAANEQKLAAASLFMPGASARHEPAVASHLSVAKAAPLVAPQAPEEKRKPKFRIFKNGPNYSQMVYEALDQANRGLTTKELRDALTGSPVRDRDSPGDRNMYLAIQRLRSNSDIVGYGGLLYSARVYEKLKANGEDLPNITETIRPPKGSSRVVLTLLRECPTGLSLKQLREAVKNAPESPPSAKAHGQYIYNILAPLLSKGEIVKVGDVFRLPENAKG